jgi:hypothetical protein
MKRLLGITTLALALVAVSAPRASAWTNVNFGVGLNFSWQSANTNWFWGAIRNGPVGVEPDWSGAHGPGCRRNGGFYGAPAGFAGPVDYGAAGAYGAPAGYGPAASGVPGPGWVAPNPAPTNQEPPAKKDGKDNKDNKDNNDQVQRTLYSAYYQSAYPQAGYNYGAYAPAYSYSPAYYYGAGYYPYGGGYYQQVPSYWQGR